MPSGAAGTFAAVARLTACPSCDSPYLQPMRCEVQDDDSVQVELRCTDCMTVLQVPYTREEMEELDRSEAACREQIVAEYERTVSESMEALAAVLSDTVRSYSATICSRQAASLRSSSSISSRV